MSAQSGQCVSDLVFYLCRLATESTGNAQAVKSLGFTEREIETLSKLTLADARRLSEQLGRHFLSSIQIDHEQLDRVLTRLGAAKKEELLQKELIKLGAPFGMMAELFGMNGHEYAGCRKDLGLTRVGRPPNLSEHEEARVYKMYQQCNGLDEPNKLLKIGMELKLNLTAVWPVVKSWGTTVEVGLEKMYGDEFEPGIAA